MNKGLLNIKDTAEMLNVSVSWLYQKVGRREIPFVRMGRALRFDMDEIERWVETQKYAVRQETR